MTNSVIYGDCKTVLQIYSDNTFDSIVTDPPYGLNFMGKEWDRGIPGVPFWEEFLRVCKPGAHMLAFGGTRTHHRLMVAIEDAGWEIRDTLMWVYGSGFPKSLDVSKAIEAKVLTGSSNKTQFKNLDGEKGTTSLGYSKIHADNDRPNNYNGREYNKSVHLTTAKAKEWEGWGTALKPAWEPIVLARKPLEGTVAENVLKWGCGGINIDGCRVEMQPDDAAKAKNNWKPRGYDLKDSIYEYGSKTIATEQNSKGRFPANIIHDGSDEVLGLFPQLNGSGSAARFFYCAKASKSERNIGCDNLPLKTPGQCTDRQEGTAGLNSPRAGAGRTSGAKNHHPTVKPLSLLQYLCRLITPPDGLILDPFGGSGTTGLAAQREGFDCIMIEIDADNYELCKRAEI